MGWRRTISHSAAVRAPGLWRIASGTPTLPMSWRRAPRWRSAIAGRDVAAPKADRLLGEAQAVAHHAVGMALDLLVAKAQHREHRADQRTGGAVEDVVRFPSARFPTPGCAGTSLRAEPCLGHGERRRDSRRRPGSARRAWRRRGAVRLLDHALPSPPGARRDADAEGHRAAGERRGPRRPHGSARRPGAGLARSVFGRIDRELLAAVAGGQVGQADALLQDAGRRSAAPRRPPGGRSCRCRP